MESEQQGFVNTQLEESELSSLKQGFVLFESIPGIPGLISGRVLTDTDIELIRQSGLKGKVKVMVRRPRNTGEAEVQAVSQTMSTAHRKLEEMQSYIKTNKSNPIIDKAAADKYSELISIKKLILRGDTYQELLVRKKTQSLEKFKDALKTATATHRKATMDTIEVCAMSEADMESLGRFNCQTVRELSVKIDQYEKVMDTFLTLAIKDKIIHTPFVENMVFDILKHMGGSFSNALIALYTQGMKIVPDYYSGHSIQVMLISLITALEQNRLVLEKAKSLSKDDINQFIALQNRFFSLDDLVNLGLAALLHDVGLKKIMPDSESWRKCEVHEHSTLELHPSEGYHLLKLLNVDYEVQRAIYQHSERMDGSGYPNGLYPRFFSKYTTVLMFAEYFVENTTDNPLSIQVRFPSEILLDILANRKAEFDPMVVSSFIRAASLFPIGSWVLLSNEEIGMVTGFKQSALKSPMVRIFLNKQLQLVKPYELDLTVEPIKVAKPVSLNFIRQYIEDPRNEVLLSA